MDEFKESLKKFLNQQNSLDDLENSVKNSISRGIEKELLVKVINELKRKSVISDYIFGRLIDVAENQSSLEPNDLDDVSSVDLRTQDTAEKINQRINEVDTPKAVPSSDVNKEENNWDFLEEFNAHKISYHTLEETIIDLFESGKTDQKLLLEQLNNSFLKGRLKSVVAKGIIDSLVSKSIIDLTTLISSETNKFLIDIGFEGVQTKENLDSENLSPLYSSDKATNKNEKADLSNDKTVVGHSIAQHKDESNTNEQDKTIVKINPDEDKTVISSFSNPSSGGLEKTSPTESITSSSESTSSTGTSGTSSTWSKPFEPLGEWRNVEVGTVLKERFRITEFIGKGGMGDVFKAEDMRRVDAGDLESEVAIKVLSKEFRDHPESLRSLQREARKTQNLAHPHIVNVFDFDRDEHNVFMTMELMDGEPLNAIIKKNPDGFAYETTRRYVKEMGEALSYAHKRGVVHSDFKPGNIFLSHDEIKVFDFGIARAAKKNVSVRQVEDNYDAGNIGALTPSYASVEMLEGKEDADPRDDIYALGCIAYELLTGCHPFYDGSKKVQANEAAREGLQAEKIKGIKPWQWKAICGCLEFKREDRTESVEIFLNQFLLNRMPISKSQIIFRGIVAAASLGLAIGGYLFWQYKEVDDFVKLLRLDNEHAILTKLADIDSLDDDKKRGFIETVKVKEAIIDYLKVKTSEYEKLNKYSEAIELASLIRKLYPDSNNVVTLDNQLKLSQKEKVAELDTKISEILNQTDILFENLSGLLQHYSDLKLISPESEILASASPFFLISDLIKALISKSEIDKAQAAITSLESFSYISNYSGFDRNELLSYNRLLNERRLYLEDEEKIINLKNELSYLAKTDELSEFLDNSKKIETLISSSSKVNIAIKILSNLHNLLSRQIDTLSLENRWVNANQLIEPFRNIKSEDLLELYQSVDENLSDYENELKDLQLKISVNLREQKLNVAEEYLEKLVSKGAANNNIRSLKEEIFQAWIKRSLVNQTLEDWEAAQLSLDNALRFASSQDELGRVTTERDEIRTKKALYTSEMARVEREKIERNKKIKIDNLSSKILNEIEKFSPDINRARAIFSDIEEFQIIGGTDDLAFEYESMLLERYVDFAEGFISEDKLDNAKSILGDAAQLFPESELLNEKVNQVLLLIAQRENRIRDEDVRRLEFKIDNFTFELGVSPDDAFSLLESYIELGGAPEKVANFKRELSSNLKDVVGMLISDNNFLRANELISEFESFGIDTSGLAETVTIAELAKQKREDEIRLEAKVSSLKQSFTAQAAAGNLLRLEEVYSELRLILPNNQVAYLDEANAVVANLAFKNAREFKTKGDFKKSSELLEKASLFESSIKGLTEFTRLISYLLSLDKSFNVNPEAFKAVLDKALKEFPEDDDVLRFASSATIDSSIPVLVKQDSIIGSEVSGTTEVANSESQPYDYNKDFVLGKPCSYELAGKGQSSRFTCWGMISEEKKGPRLVVVPSFNDLTFAITRYEIRVEEYNDFCISTNSCNIVGKDNNLPITGISVSQIVAYSEWLSKKTGKTYRLPTYDEWKFASDANGISQKYKNCKAYIGGVLQRGMKLEAINFLGRDAQNGWGLRNYLGNAGELVTDGFNYWSAGGSFEDPYKECIIDNKKNQSGMLGSDIGFRLVVEL